MTGNPFHFLVVGILPYPIIKIYKRIHDPYDRIEGAIREADPELYDRSVQEESKSMVLRMGSSDKA